MLDFLRIARVRRMLNQKVQIEKHDIEKMQKLADAGYCNIHVGNGCDGFPAGKHRESWYSQRRTPRVKAEDAGTAIVLCGQKSFSANAGGAHFVDPMEMFPQFNSFSSEFASRQRRI